MTARAEVKMTATLAATGVTCDRCRDALRYTVYEMRSGARHTLRCLRCLRCALTHRPLVRRSLLISLIVGTVLTAINQGNIIAQGGFPAALYLKVPLTYAVPYCVATAGAILNARSRLFPG